MKEKKKNWEPNYGISVISFDIFILKLREIYLLHYMHMLLEVETFTPLLLNI